VPAEEVQGAVNRIEAAIRARFPEVKRIYIEARRVGDHDAVQSIALSEEEANREVEGRSAVPHRTWPDPAPGWRRRINPGRPPMPSPPAR
jgi:hypothetical protein